MEVANRLIVEKQNRTNHQFIQLKVKVQTAVLWFNFYEIEWSLKRSDWQTNNVFIINNKSKKR